MRRTAQSTEVGAQSPIAQARPHRQPRNPIPAAERPVVRGREDGNAPAIIFDVEGTLVDCTAQTLECWQGTLREFGHEFSIPALHPFLGLDTDDMLHRLLPNVDAKEKRAITERQGKRYRELYLPSVGAFPGTHRVLEQLRRAGHAIGLATSCQRDELAFYVKVAGLSGLFDAVACGDDQGMRGKPHPHLLGAVLRRLRHPEHAVDVGDTPYDAMAARHMGLRAVGMLASGFRVDELKQAGCDAVIGALPELLALLHHMPARQGARASRFQ